MPMPITTNGLFMPHFEDGEPQTTWYVCYEDGKRVPYSSEEVARRSAEYQRQQGHDNVTVEAQTFTLRREIGYW